jgi:pyruvate dehydrogenase E2 component (dihydrolipoyllysine-residue acetyltransferase)
VASEIVMPRLSDSMEEGTILRWLKSVGDEVAQGEELVEIETDKANMVYEADAGGTLVEIVAEEGATLPIGEVIARVGEAGEAPSGDGAAESADGGQQKAEAEQAAGSEEQAAEAEGADSRQQVEAVEEPAPAPEPAPAEEPVSAPTGDGRVKASPLARRIARERGLELKAISGSGPGGRIVKADVERAVAAGPAPGAAPPAEAAPAPAEAPAAAAAPTPGARERPETAKGTTEPVELTRLQQTVARRMAESKATAPHFYLDAEVDMSRAVAARAALKASAREGEVVPSFNDFVVKAAAIALRENPRANGAYRDGGLELYSRVNVGIAVAAQNSLVVPTVFDADKKGLRQIAEEARSLAARVRDGTVTPPELSGGTFTVSNLGMYGITSFSAVINPPQAGILAVGAITERPVVRDGEITTAHLMTLTLACDHRILYGAEGAEFLARIVALLTEPVGLAL